MPKWKPNAFIVDDPNTKINVLKYDILFIVFVVHLSILCFLPSVFLFLRFIV